MIHELKTWPEPFEAVASGRKTHELRTADRPFQAGDVLRLREFWPKHWARRLNGPMTNEIRNGYTGREVYVAVTYVTRPGEWGLPGQSETHGRLPGDTEINPGLCCMSVRLMSAEEIALEVGLLDAEFVPRTEDRG